MNRLLAFLCLLFGAPFLLLIAILIKLDSPGPALFRQRRIGQNNIEFFMLKFRTMQVGMPDLPSDQVAETDHRFTGIGKFLRRFSLDELPQLWNVVRGEMNFVGPRPALYNQYDLNERRIARGIHKIKPGITGWAQVNGRNALSWEAKFKLDVWYVDNWSLWLDLKIIGMTIWKVLRREGISQEGQATMTEFKGTERKTEIGAASRASYERKI